MPNVYGQRDNLTPKQAEIYRMICEGYAAGEPPSQKEIADALGISKPTVHEHIQAIISKGYLNQPNRKARNLSPRGEIDERYVDEMVAVRKADLRMLMAGQPDGFDLQEQTNWLEMMDRLDEQLNPENKELDDA